MKKHTDEAIVRQTAEKYLESKHQRDFDIVKSKWRCHEGNDCPDIHDVYAIATDEAEIQVVVTLDFRKDPPKVTRDSYEQEIASLKATRDLEEKISSSEYLLRAYAQTPGLALPQKPLMVKLYVTDTEKTTDERVLQTLKDIIIYGSENQYELLDVEVAFFKNLPSVINKHDFNLGSFTEEETVYEKENKVKTWRFETGGRELKEPESLLSNPMKNIKVLD